MLYVADSFHIQNEDKKKTKKMPTCWLLGSSGFPWALYECQEVVLLPVWLEQAEQMLHSLPTDVFVAVSGFIFVLPKNVIQKGKQNNIKRS